MKCEYQINYLNKNNPNNNIKVGIIIEPIKLVLSVSNLKQSNPSAVDKTKTTIPKTLSKTKVTQIKYAIKTYLITLKSILAICVILFLSK